MNATEKRQVLIQFGMWLGTPSEFRDPKHQDEFAQQHNVGPVFLSRHKNDPLVKEMQENTKKTLVGNRMWEIIKGQTEKAVDDKNTAAARLMMEYAGELKPKIDKSPLGIVRVEFVTDRRQDSEPSD